MKKSETGSKGVQDRVKQFKKDLEEYADFFEGKEAYKDLFGKRGLKLSKKNIDKFLRSGIYQDKEISVKLRELLGEVWSSLCEYSWGDMEARERGRGAFYFALLNSEGKPITKLMLKMHTRLNGQFLKYGERFLTYEHQTDIIKRAMGWLDGPPFFYKEYWDEVDRGEKSAIDYLQKNLTDSPNNTKMVLVEIFKALPEAERIFEDVFPNEILDSSG